MKNREISKCYQLTIVALLIFVLGIFDSRPFAVAEDARCTKTAELVALALSGPNETHKAPQGDLSATLAGLNSFEAYKVTALIGIDALSGCVNERALHHLSNISAHAKEQLHPMIAHSEERTTLPPNVYKRQQESSKEDSTVEQKTEVLSY